MAHNHSSIPSDQADPYCTFSLALLHPPSTLLPAGHKLQLNTQTGALVVLDGSGSPLAGDAIISQEALPIIALLLYKWPSYVPNEQLLNALEEVPEVTQLPEGDQALQERVDRLVSASREALQQVGLDVLNLEGDGYKIVAYDAHDLLCRGG